MLRTAQTSRELALYKTIVKIENKTFEYNGKNAFAFKRPQGSSCCIPGRASALYVDVYPCV